MRNVADARLNINRTPTYSLYFGDTTARVSLSTGTLLKSLTALTIEGYIFLNSTPTYLARLCDCQFSNKGYNLEVDTNRCLQVNIGNGTTTGNKTGGQVIPLLKWTFIAVSWDGTTIRLFVDGVFDSGNTASLSGGNTGDPSTLYLGNNSSFNRGFPGRIQDIRISNNARYTDTYTPSTTQLTTDINTIALWHFDDGTGTSATDSSGNNLTGTLGGTVLPRWSLGGFVKSGSTTRITAGTRTAI
jgi:hypothetical protein